MFETLQTKQFESWQSRIMRSDPRSGVRITIRIQRLISGNLGDHKKLNENLYELRLHFGPGYRIYFSVLSSEMLILLYGGDKSTQRADIDKANEILKSLGEK